MAMSNPLRKEGGGVNPIVIGIIVLLALIVVFGVSLAVSANRALGLVQNARGAFSEASSSLEEGNFEAAYASARTAVDNVSALPKELEGVQWSIASVLPILGDDVRTAREMSSIAAKLANEAASPVFDQWDLITQKLEQDDGTSIADRAGALVEELQKLADTLVDAKQVIYECEERTNSLPEAHIGQLNDAIGDLKEAMSKVGEMLRSFDRATDAVKAAGLLGGTPDLIKIMELFDNEDIAALINELKPLLGT